MFFFCFCVCHGGFTSYYVQLSTDKMYQWSVRNVAIFHICNMNSNRRCLNIWLTNNIFQTIFVHIYFFQEKISHINHISKYLCGNWHRNETLREEKKPKILSHLECCKARGIINLQILMNRMFYFLFLPPTQGAMSFE